jgi:hypothetical protein
MAENEALARKANERMAGWRERDRGEALELYFCECASAECTEKVTLRTSDYERVRSDPDRFCVAPGHEAPEIEKRLESHPGWVMVEKTAAQAREVAEDTDPRT